MNIVESTLREYIGCILLEASFSKEFDTLDKLWKDSNFQISDFEKMINDEGYSLIGKGFTRRVYAKDDDFVIKIATTAQNSLVDSNPNQGDVDINASKVDLNIRNLIPKVLHSSPNNEWIVCEKVNVIKKDDDDVITTLFPCTIELKKIITRLFKKEISFYACLNMLVKLNKKKVKDDFSGSNYENIIKDNLVENIRNFARFKGYSIDERHVNFIKSNIKLDTGILKLFTAMQSVQSTDLRYDNLGYRLPLKPYDFVIIDFDYLNFNQDKSVKLFNF